jgi:hypothetical protein
MKQLVRTGQIILSILMIAALPAWFSYNLVAFEKEQQVIASFDRFRNARIEQTFAAGYQPLDVQWHSVGIARLLGEHAPKCFQRVTKFSISGYPELTDEKQHVVSFTKFDFERVVELSQLESLTLYFTQVTDNDLKHLPRLNRIVQLEIGDDKLTDASLRYIAQLPNLRELRLEYTKITDNGLRQLAPLKHLETLDLDETSVTDAVFEVLEQFPKLQSIEVRGTRVTQQAVDRLWKQKRYQTIIF